MKPATNAAQPAEPETAREQVRAEPAQHDRQQRHEIEREHRVAGEPEHGRRDERAADEVLGVREGIRLRMVDVGVEDCQRLVEEGVGVPGSAST